MEPNEIDFLKVSADSKPSSVGSVITKMFTEDKKNEVILQACGAGAVNQAVKAIAAARSFTASFGLDLYCIPAFTTISVEIGDRTAIQFTVKKR